MTSLLYKHVHVFIMILAMMAKITAKRNELKSYGLPQPATIPGNSVGIFPSPACLV